MFRYSVPEPEVQKQVEESRKMWHSGGWQRAIRRSMGFGTGSKLERRGSKWILPAGTVVKHGTSSGRVARIFETGKILCSGKVKSSIGRGALIRFLNWMSPRVYLAKDILAYSASLYECSAHFSGDPTRDLGVPMVLNIMLREDCPIRVDEIFHHASGFSEFSSEVAEEVCWNKFGTAVIARDIPVDYIESVEYMEPTSRVDADIKLLHTCVSKQSLTMARGLIERRGLGDDHAKVMAQFDRANDRYEDKGGVFKLLEPHFRLPRPLSFSSKVPASHVRELLMSNIIFYDYIHRTEFMEEVLLKLAKLRQDKVKELGRVFGTELAEFLLHLGIRGYELP